MNEQFGESGRQGEAGVPGRQGEAGVAGAEGAVGAAGATGATGAKGTIGATGLPGIMGAPGAQPKLRWAPAVGYVILLALVVFLIWRIQTSCVDARASFALRHQWERVAELIDAQTLKPGEPGYLTPEQIRQRFADSYRQALDEAGPPPDCKGILP